ncbi:hypothetical protein M407DRAFT_27258 [Tulasnella calospora MUT 4182]|uniref:F-box domain-containing protein n=1 Tax=Tulasnella calospora MUT 4182 TaxID=1051891 RepID=A0A0C3LPC3_9AGAM|nr:hypothetical protein M407DRAFT_27258 [Tulasnella calospora MUT 4182]
MPAVDTGIDNSSSQSRTQVCPINDLPYDVFYFILATCWEDAQRDYWGRKTHFPTIASHVCRTWRQHAIDTPSFWAKLTFRSKIPQLDKYQEWLTRLGGAPFDVYIGQEPFTSASIKRTKGIMRLIMPHISHLRSFQVSYVPTKILRLIFDRLNDANAPLLQRLRVEKRSRTVHGDLCRKRWEPRPFHQGQAPNLEQVHLSGMSYGYIMDRFGASLNTFIISPITNLVTPHNYAKIAQDILSRAPNLRVFGFLIHPFYRDTADQWIQTFQSPPLPSVTHSSLEELYIGGYRRDWDVIVVEQRGRG